MKQTKSKRQYKKSFEIIYFTKYVKTYHFQKIKTKTPIEREIYNGVIILNKQMYLTDEIGIFAYFTTPISQNKKDEKALTYENANKLL